MSEEVLAEIPLMCLHELRLVTMRLLNLVVAGKELVLIVVIDIIHFKYSTFFNDLIPSANNIPLSIKLATL